MSSSSVKSHRLSWVASHLTLAEAILALQREVLSIKADLAQRATTGSTSRCISIDWERLARAMEALRDTMKSPAAQSIIALFSPLVVAVVRALRAWLGL
jgi:hypothetical protein